MISDHDRRATDATGRLVVFVSDNDQIGEEDDVVDDEWIRQLSWEQQMIMSDYVEEKTSVIQYSIQNKS